MLGSNLVQAAAAVTQFNPIIRLRYKNQRKKEGAPSRLTCRIRDLFYILRESRSRIRLILLLNTANAMAQLIARVLCQTKQKTRNVDIINSIFGTRTRK